jgi:hypothetical protein
LRKGSNQAQELDKIIEKGLGNGKPLSRNQLSRKFKQLKGSFESEKSIRKLDEAKIENGVELYGRLKKTDCWICNWRSLCVSTCIVSSLLHSARRFMAGSPLVFAIFERDSSTLSTSFLQIPRKAEKTTTQ